MTTYAPNGRDLEEEAAREKTRRRPRPSPDPVSYSDPALLEVPIPDSWTGLVVCALFIIAIVSIPWWVLR